MRFGRILLLAAAATAPCGSYAVAQGVGPFTQAQVTAGRAAYGPNCGACHGPALAGTMPDAPAVTGKQFTASWATRTTRELWQFISISMPEGNEGGLDAKTYLNLVAFLLAANGAKPGPVAFTPTTQVKIGTIANGHTVTAVIHP